MRSSLGLQQWRNIETISLVVSIDENNLFDIHLN